MNSSKKILVLLAPGFEEVEFVTPVDMWRRMDLKVTTASIGDDLAVEGSHGIVCQADKLLSEIDLNSPDFDLLYLPGGMPGTINLAESKTVIELVQSFNNSKKWISAICAAPIILSKANIITDKKVTSYPSVESKLNCKSYLQDSVVIDDNIITSRGAGTAALLAFEVGKVLGFSDKADEVSEAMLFFVPSA